MVALYKDPKGENVFGEYCPPSLKSQHGSVAESNMSTTDSALRKRIVELENIIEKNQVHTSVHVICMIQLATIKIKILNFHILFALPVDSM